LISPNILASFKQEAGPQVSKTLRQERKFGIRDVFRSFFKGLSSDLPVGQESDVLHRREISHMELVFLKEHNYAENGRSSTDYREPLDGSG
jgi:hypothetical protein